MTSAEDAAATLAAPAPARTGTTGAGRRGLVAFLLVAAVAVAFGNALENGFVYDDGLLVVDNPVVRAPLTDLDALGFYRPLRTLSYRLDYALGGLDPRVFHGANLVYHALTVLLVRAVLARIGISPWAATAGALVFAVHPVQTDAVTYVAGRRDILCGLFFVAGFLFYLRYRETRRRRELAAALMSYILAILAKEMAITLPIVCLLFDRVSMARATPATGRYRLFAILAAAGGVVAWTFYGRFVERVMAVTPWHGGTPGTNLATVLRVWAHYLWLILWPARLSADYSYRAFPVSTSVLDPRAGVAAAVLGGLAVLTWWRWRRGDVAAFGATWWAATLLPVSHIVPYRELLAEHYLYVPMMGVACVVAAATDAAVARTSAPRVVAAVVTVAVLAATTRTIVRNRDWHDELSLWSATVATAPECARARFNLGQTYVQQMRFAEAEREWLAAATLTPDDLDTVLALAMLYYRQGRFAEAEQWVGVALERRSDDVRVANLAGWIALDGGDAARALSRFDGALAHAADVVEGGGRHARARAAAVDGARLGRAQATAALAAASGGGVRP